MTKQTVIEKTLSEFCFDTGCTAAAFSSDGNLIYCSTDDNSQIPKLLTEYSSLPSEYKNSSALREISLPCGRYTLFVKMGEPYDDRIASILFSMLSQTLSDGCADFPAQMKRGILQPDLVARVDEASAAPGVCALRLLSIEAHTEALPGILDIVVGLNADGGDIIAAADDSLYIIKQMYDSEAHSEGEEFARALMDTIICEVGAGAFIAVSCEFGGSDGLLAAYSDLCDTMLAGRLCFNDENVFASERLTTEKFLASLPDDKLRTLFASPAFDGITDLNDDKIVQTIKCLLANDLNITEASRQLYIHRNTLVYRLEKLRSATGLDPKRFPDAVVFDLYMTAAKILEARS